LVLLQAIFLHQRRGEVGAVLFHLGVADALFGDGVGVAAESGGWVVSEGGVGGVEQPVPDREVGGHCGWLSVEMLRADDGLDGGLTVNVWLS